MTLHCLTLNLLILNVGLASARDCNGIATKEFTENPQDNVLSNCPSSSNDGVGAHWRGELSFTHTETFIRVQWKKMVKKPECVHAMKFFVDGEEEKDVWGKNNEDVKINTVGMLTLKVVVQYTYHWNMLCLEATANITTTTTTINITSPSDNVIPLVVGAFAGGNLYMPQLSSHIYHNYHTTYYCCDSRYFLHFVPAGTDFLHCHPGEKKVVPADSKRRHQRHVWHLRYHWRAK